MRKNRKPRNWRIICAWIFIAVFCCSVLISMLLTLRASKDSLGNNERKPGHTNPDVGDDTFGMQSSGIHPESKSRTSGNKYPLGKKMKADYETRSDKVSADAPGEMGREVGLDSFGPLNQQAQRLYEKELFNLMASDRMSVQRSLAETRSVQCQTALYERSLPKASIIIVFYNEPLSTLLRTIWSCINRSRPEHLKEILLVDDGSEREELGASLPLALDQQFGKRVRLLRFPHKGLIKAKLHGARNASGDVLVYLDAHCEANVGWLEPLLTRIKENRQRIVCPMIDTITAKEYAYQPSVNWATGLFSWSLYFKWGLTELESKRVKDIDAEPHRTPTFPGGIFAMDRRWFFEMGAYDEAMEGWGGENLEMSFRIWMCGGSIEFHPCSRVAHRHTYSHADEHHHHGINSARLAEVWMDDYKRFLYLVRPELKNAHIGELAQRIALKKRLRCRDFKWYLANVLPEKFVPDENVIAWGQIRNAHRQLCLTTKSADEHVPSSFTASPCSDVDGKNFWQQLFSYSLEFELRREEWCLGMDPRSDAVMEQLCDARHRLTWTYTDKQWLINDGAILCLTASNTNVPSNIEIAMKPCDNSMDQKWVFGHMIHPEKVISLPSSLLSMTFS